MTAESCPHCFAPARANGRPGCTCAERAAASTATAGATDDQTRPNPQVTLPEERPAGPDPRDLRLFEETEGENPGNAETPGVFGKGDGEETRVIDRVEERPGGDEGDEGDAADAATDAPGPGRHRKSKRKVVAAVLAGAAAVAVAGSLAIGTGLLGDHKEDGSGGGGASDHTLADSTVSPPAEEELPAEGPGTSSGSPSSSTTPHPSASGSARAGATPKSEGGPSGSARPSESASATGSPTKPGPSASDAPTSAPSDTPEPPGPPVLREGDSGPEVVELQKRLTQLLQYIGVADGKYDEGLRRIVSSYQDQHDITGDPDGVYGENTRRDLESRTDEP
ncbi:peptidoglycan-binding domain-containing protein [Streptomyces rhizosphaericus]|uniref:Peptidoglycan-binding protein n=1 Tax=Streptomyces rhizosphaericus TaxID=114699 RepID=A0A6G4AJS5_9ACTN|nr:peptidoglycan-binding domain-containing protein [Streptomyces rhizosphaericus]NEW73490.1 peptidoglycan-binding protein [Streptomyces rhizosphaericus]